MDPTDLQAYRRRWLAVEEFEKQESRTASFELRWKQLNSLAGLALALGIMPMEDRQ